MDHSPEVKLKVQKRSGFDKSFSNLLTTKVGTLTPVLVDELIPNSSVNLHSVVSASLPPLASDTFMRCNLKLEAFFVPKRLIYGGYEDWLTGQKMYDPDQSTWRSVHRPILHVNFSDSAEQAFLAPGTLMDYLGYRRYQSMSSGSANFNIEPAMAYHRIYDDWYRNTLVQKPVFQRPIYDAGGDFSFADSLSSMPFAWYSNTTNFVLTDSFYDGVALGQLRQRNFGLDYFTSAMPFPQMGTPQQVIFNTSGGTGSFTIAALRAANSLQQFAERNQLAGYRLQDYVKANYGADLSSGVAQRSIYLGSSEIPVYSKGVYSNSLGTSASVSTNNPFASSIGAEFGSASCSGESTLVDSFTANEPGYLMVMASLVPIVTYSSGIDRILFRYNSENSQTDMANPQLQNVGNQPIFQFEVSDQYYTSQLYFGYTDRYADFKNNMHDQLHGLLRNGQPLAAFALQRAITGSPTIDSNFLEIPTSYLDDVSAVTGDVSNYGVWIDSFFRYFVSQPLAEYSIPSLQDPAYEHGDDVSIHVGGSRL